MTNFLFRGFLPDQNIRLPLPRAAIRGEAPHPPKHGRKGLGGGGGGQKELAYGDLQTPAVEGSGATPC